MSLRFRTDVKSSTVTLATFHLRQKITKEINAGENNKRQ